MMSNGQVSRWAGAFGLAGFVVFLVALPLYFGGTAAPLEDTARFSDYVTSINTAVLIRTSLADPLIMVGLARAGCSSSPASADPPGPRPRP